MIVCFINRDVRYKIYANRRKARNVDMNQFLVRGTKKIFINENLMPTRKLSFWKVKQQAMAEKWNYYWTNDGNVFTKKYNGSSTVAIRNDVDLNLIKN